MGKHIHQLGKWWSNENGDLFIKVCCTAGLGLRMNHLECFVSETDDVRRAPQLPPVPEHLLVRLKSAINKCGHGPEGGSARRPLQMMGQRVAENSAAARIGLPTEIKPQLHVRANHFGSRGLNLAEKRIPRFRKFHTPVRRLTGWRYNLSRLLNLLRDWLADWLCRLL